MLNLTRDSTSCSHPDHHLIIVRSNVKHHDSDGDMYIGAEMSLGCSACKAVLASDSDTFVVLNDHKPSLANFQRAYKKFTQRDLFTDDDRNQINLLATNPKLFWMFEPANSKYIIRAVPSQLDLQNKIDKLTVQYKTKLQEAHDLKNQISDALKESGRAGLSIQSHIF